MGTSNFFFHSTRMKTRNKDGGPGKTFSFPSSSSACLFVSLESRRPAATHLMIEYNGVQGVSISLSLSHTHTPETQLYRKRMRRSLISISTRNGLSRPYEASKRQKKSKMRNHFFLKRSIYVITTGGKEGGLAHLPCLLADVQQGHFDSVRRK